METENMDSFSNFYDLIDEDGSAKLKDQAEISEDGYPALTDLDPSVELSLDLQELIGGAAGKPITDASLQLFPELASCPEIDNIVKRDQNSEQQTQDISRTEVSSPQESSTLQPTEHMFKEIEVAATDDQEGSSLQPTEHMFQEIEVAAADDACPVFTVKESDLVALGLKPGSTSVSGATYIKLEPITEAVSTEQAVVSSTEHHYTKPVGRNPLKSPATTRGSTNRRRHLEKGSKEYKEKRERNNIAVRKSRDKAKVRQKGTEQRVQELTEQNQQLQRKVDLMSKELAVLKGFFTNVGASIPEGLAELLK